MTKDDGITRESVWNDDPSTSATGGGISKLYNLPPWAKKPNDYSYRQTAYPARNAQGSPGHRRC